jgi:hypothetical protein
MIRIAITTSILAMALASPAPASTIAFDDASDPVYDDGWDDGDDGGSGWFGGWVGLTSAGFVATSTTNGNGDDDMDGDIDTGGRAWAVTLSTASVPSNMWRRLDGPLEIGQTITVEMDHDAVPEPGRAGMRLTSSLGEQRFALLWIGSSQDYFALGAGFEAMNVPYTDEGLTVVFQLTAVDSFSVDLTPIGGSTTTVSGSLDSGIDITNLLLNSSSSGTAETFFFNSIAVPELGSDASAAAALATLMLIARKRLASA